MRRFRKRKPKVMWLPQPGTKRTVGGQAILPATENPAWVEFAFSAPLTNSPTTVEAPLVIDNPITTDVAATASIEVWRIQTLESVNQPAYRLRRIVGDIFAGVALSAPGDIPAPGWMLELGIMVRRVDSDGAVAVDGVDQDCGSIQNNSDPWIWRRNWLFGSGQAFTPALQAVVSSFPGTTAGYGNARHVVDQKTARIVGPEERLIFNATAWLMPSANPTNPDTTADIYCVFDYRVLASLYVARGNRSNATR